MPRNTSAARSPGRNTSPAPLPDDLEQAAIEQVAFWFQKRSQLGIRISSPSGGTYQQFAAQDLLPSVQATLARYQRWSLWRLAPSQIHA